MSLLEYVGIYNFDRQSPNANKKEKTVSFFNENSNWIWLEW